MCCSAVLPGLSCLLLWERRTTCWVTLWVPNPNVLVVCRPPLFREGWDLDTCRPAVRVPGACSGGGGGGGACARPVSCPALIRLGQAGAAKCLLRCFLVPKGNQPTACTLALWWLKFGPTGYVYYTALYCIVLCCIKLYCIVLYCTVLYYTVEIATGKHTCMPCRVRTAEKSEFIRYEWVGKGERRTTILRHTSGVGGPTTTRGLSINHLG